MIFYRCISKVLEKTISVHYGRSPGASSQQPVASSQRPASRVRYYGILLTLMACLLWTSLPAAEVSEKDLPYAFTDVISKLSALGDRSTGTAGNQEAAL